MPDSKEREMLTRDERLAADGYWPARAAEELAEGRYSSAVRLCRQHLADQPDLLSGRLMFALALFRAGHNESATEQFHYVLSLDPDHIVALKHLGDIQFAAGDGPAAMTNYNRVLQVDPGCSGLCSPVKGRLKETTHTITLSRGSEPGPEKVATLLRPIPFYTETMGDLYLSQGYPRMAAEVYRRLIDQNENPRLAEKLAGAENKLKEKHR